MYARTDPMERNSLLWGGTPASLYKTAADSYKLGLKAKQSIIEVPKLYNKKTNGYINDAYDNFQKMLNSDITLNKNLMFAVSTHLYNEEMTDEVAKSTHNYELYYQLTRTDIEKAYEAY